MKAVIYTRFSPRPDDLCESLDFQEDYVRRYFAYLHIEVGAVIRDPDTSARLTPLSQRTGGQQLLALTTGHRPEYTVVGAYRLDRLWRHVVDGNLTLTKWKKKRVACHFAAEGGQSLNTTTATGEFLVNILLAKAQYEPALTSERTSTAMLRHQQLGRAMSAIPPYGMQRGEDLIVVDSTGKPHPRRQWIPSEDEQHVIQHILTLHAEGWKTPTIANRLNDAGFDCRGHAWTRLAVSRILKRVLHTQNHTSP